MHQVNLTETQSFLNSLLSQGSSNESLSWFRQKTAQFESGFAEKDFYLVFSQLPRFFRKEKIKFIEGQLQAASCLRKGFDPSEFTEVQAARVMLALMIPSEDVNRFLKILNNLFSTGEVNELVALYAAMPLLSNPDLLKTRASEGIRTNMTVVFDAIAMSNPYPAEFLDENAFNQMVLKAVFVERPLNKIYGLDQRANEKLARMLSDYAHERWAASRYVTPELWRPVGPFIDERLLKDIERLLEQGSELEKQAATLAIQSSRFVKAKELIPLQLKAGVDRNEFNWHTVSEKWFAEKK